MIYGKLYDYRERDYEAEQEWRDWVADQQLDWEDCEHER
jgi:hypothetical protein